MGLIVRTNDALKVNPPTGDVHHLTTAGSDWLWALTAVYCLELLVVLGWTFTARQGEKIFHYLFTISLLAGAISYFTMASDLGSVPIATSTGASGTREIFYARYINWFVGWTPLVLAIGLFSGVSWATIIYNIVLTWAWIVSWLAGALVATTWKWGYFVFGTFIYFILALSLLHTGSITAGRLGITKHYTGLTGYLVFLWLLYPIAWGLDDGGNKIRVTSGFIFFGILDFFTVPVLALVMLFLSNSWDYRNLNLYFTQYGRVAQGTGDFPEREKAPATATPAAPAAAATPATTV